MGISDLQRIIRDAFTAGRMDAQVELGARKDKLSRKIAEYYIKGRGYTPSDLKNWVREGFVVEHVGEKINSPHWFSLKQINEAILSIEISMVI